MLRRRSLLPILSVCAFLTITYLVVGFVHKHLSTPLPSEVFSPPPPILSHYAFVSFLSRPEDVDAALVLGYTLARSSSCVSLGTCVTILLLHDADGWGESLHRLRLHNVGWGRLVHVAAFDRRMILNMKGANLFLYLDISGVVHADPDPIFTSFAPGSQSEHFILLAPDPSGIMPAHREPPGSINHYVAFPDPNLHHAAPWLPPGPAPQVPTLYYILWWDSYDAYHREFELSATSFPHGTSPLTHNYMMRNTTSAYTTWHMPYLRHATNVTLEGLSLVASGEGRSCDTACADRLEHCEERALQWWGINSCDAAKYFSPGMCVVCVPALEEPMTSTGPAVDLSAKTCWINSLRFPAHIPTCRASAEHLSRLCPCVPFRSFQQRPMPFVGYSPFGVLLGDATRPARASYSESAARTPTMSPCDPSSTNFTDDTDRSCLDYLTDTENMEEMMALPSTNTFGRTVKMQIAYKGGTVNDVRAIAKFPQGLFPLEAYAEIIGYYVDRALGFAYVPPTSFGFLPLSMIEAAAYHSSQGASYGKWIGTELFAHALRNRLIVPDAETGKLVIFCSLQLWLDEISLQSHTDLAYSDADLKYLEGDVAVPEPRARIVAHLSDMLLFDAIMGNGDRQPNKNNYVAGGCVKKSCMRAGGHAHKGPSQYVHLDQGKALYERGIPSSNPFSATSVRSVCKFRAKVAGRLRGLAKRDGDTLLDLIKAKTPSYMLKEIGDTRLGWLQERLESVVAKLEDCVKKYGEANVMMP